MTADLIEALPGKLEKTLAETLLGTETVAIRLKGAFKEALVCTDQRVLVLKSGFMTGQTFGVNVFQLAYAAVSSADVKFNLMSGYFELSAGGVQSTSKSYWEVGKGGPTQAPNCISITDKKTAQRFREACTFITTRVAAVRNPAPPAPQADTVVDALERLAALRASGVLTDEEFAAAKARLLSA